MSLIRNKAVLALIVLVCGTVFFWFILSDSNEGVKDLKIKLQTLETSIDELDVKIHSLVFSKPDPVLLDSLKKKQQSMWVDYQNVRKNLVAAADDSPRSFLITSTAKVTRRLGNIYTVILLLGIPAAAFLLLKRKKVLSRKIAVPKRRMSSDAVPNPADYQKSIQEKLRQAIERVDKIRQTQTEQPDQDVTAYKIYAKPEKSQVSELDLIDENAETQLDDSVIDEGNEEINPVPVSHLHGPESTEIEIIPPTIISRHAAANEPVHVLTEDKAGASEEGSAPDLYMDTISENHINEPVNMLEIMKMARRGSTISEISKRFKISQDEVELILRTGRESS